MRSHWALAFVAVATLAAPLPASSAEGSSLRGLRPPGLIDFAPMGAQRAGVPLWPPGADPRLESVVQPSPLYGMRERLPNGSAAGPAYLTYSYSDSVTGVFEAGPALRGPYTTSYAVSGQLVRSFRSGLGVGLGLRQRPAGSNVVAVAVQQGWGPFSGGYTLYSGRSDAAPSPAQRFALNFNYSDRSRIGLSYTTGRDLQAGLLPFTPGVDSRDWSLSGYHLLAPQWALTYDVVNSDQAAYRRQGLHFGIRHTF